MLSMRDFDDLPEGWAVEEQEMSNVRFDRADRGAHVLLFQDEDHDYWVTAWDDRHDEALFQQRFGPVGDAIRSAYSVMEFYNVLWSRTVSEVMDDVSLVFTLTETFGELREDVDEDAQEMTDELAEKIETAIRDGDYDMVQRIAETANSVAREHLESTE